MAFVAIRNAAPLMRVAGVRNSTGATFPRVKGIPRPTVTELSGGQNKVLHYAEQFACNKTPTWCKAPEDKATNYVGGALCATSFFMLGKCAHDMAYGVNKIEGK